MLAEHSLIFSFSIASPPASIEVIGDLVVLFLSLVKVFDILVNEVNLLGLAVVLAVIGIIEPGILFVVIIAPYPLVVFIAPYFLVVIIPPYPLVVMITIDPPLIPD